MYFQEKATRVRKSFTGGMLEKDARLGVDINQPENCKYMIVAKFTELL